MTTSDGGVPIVANNVRGHSHCDYPIDQMMFRIPRESLERPVTVVLWRAFASVPRLEGWSTRPPLNPHHSARTRASVQESATKKANREWLAFVEGWWGGGMNVNSVRVTRSAFCDAAD